MLQLKRCLPNKVEANLSELVRLSPSQQYDDIDIQQNLFVHVYMDMIYDVEFHMF